MKYFISTGTLQSDSGESVLTNCYSGGDAGLRPEAVNNSAFCSVPNVGPLPMGIYTVGPLITHPQLGPAMALTPDSSNIMYGRGDFYAHYNNPKRDAGLSPYPPIIGRNSSDGCIVSVVPGSLTKVQALVDSGENILTVTA